MQSIGAWTVGAIGLLILIGSIASRPRESPQGVDLASGFAKGDRRALSLMNRGCANCHSDRTRWPWYGYLFPATWLLQRDVLKGRNYLNYSLWEQYGVAGQSQLLVASAEQVQTGAMPPARYRILHPEAQFSFYEKQYLVAWFRRQSTHVGATVAQEGDKE